MLRGLARAATGLLLAPLAIAPVQAQQPGFAGACAEMDETLRLSCAVTAQAVDAIQADLGVLIAGGNPTIGTATSAGLRLGMLPRVNVAFQAGLVHAGLPDLREARVQGNDAIRYGERSQWLPSVGAAASIALYPGFSVAPTVGGIGSVDVLGRASWLPLRMLGADDFLAGSTDVSYGAGVRVGIVRESFTTPGASVSVMVHRTQPITYGGICPDRVPGTQTPGPGYVVEEGVCAPTDRGDLGEMRLNVRSWSTRAVVSKHLMGLGLAAGVGYDRFASEVSAGVRRPSGEFADPVVPYARVRGLETDQGRFSAFANGSWSLLVAALAVEAGWMQGGDAVSGYPAGSSDFDPGAGSFFGSVGLRVGL